MDGFLFQLIGWIALVFDYMDDVILFPAGTWFEDDISLLDVSFSVLIVFAVVQMIFANNDIDIED